MAPRWRSRPASQTSGNQEEGIARSHPTEHIPIQEEIGTTQHLTETERLAQLFTQNLQETRDQFAELLTAHQGRGETSAPHRALLGDPWVYQMERMGQLRFEGSDDPMRNRKWLKEIENTFETLCVPMTDWVRLAVYHLRGDADEWWRKTKELEFEGRPTSTIEWSRFTASFNKEYFPIGARLALQREFWELEQGSKSVEEYAAEFRKLEVFASSFDCEEARTDRFVSGLRDGLRSRIILGECKELRTVIMRAIRIEKDFAKIQDRKGKTRTFTKTPQAEYRPPYSSGSSGSDKKRKFQSGSYYRGSSGGNSSVGSDRGSVNMRTCYNCGRPGHLAPQCRFQGQKPVTVRCYNCGKPGHMQRQCPEPPKKAGDASVPPSKGRVFTITTPDAGMSGGNVVEGK